MFFSRAPAKVIPTPPVQTTITLASGTIVPLELKRRRGMTRMVLRFDAKRSTLVASGPPATSQKALKQLAEANLSWIETQLSRTSAMRTSVQDGDLVMLYGKPCVIRRVAGRGRVTLQPDPQGQGPAVLSIRASEAGLAAATRRAFQAMAHVAALEHLAALEKVSGLKPKALALRDTRSRWGSCTSDGRIMVSWRLVAADPAVFHYVVAHEMAHLRHMNHSSAFWALVETMVPDWQVHRRWLRTQGARLHQNGV
jgi:predicted metal-dependent hydrolase